ncbi:type VII secretion target [Gordonia sp. CPCC 205333]|uniref:type VII secretion target n=1 Tax=Gordonia sp. CPCC 205333 TaxID=3140790 RepID=UPI003AF401E4
MDTLTISPEALQGYATATASTAALVASAGAVNAAANTTAMIGVFGLIGQEFLAEFIGAQANHLFSIGSLAAVHAGTAATALAGSTDYRSADAAGAVGIGAL